MSKEFKLSKATKNFRILGFTDTHIDDWVERGVYTWLAIEQTIKTEKPDLVVFVGDNVTGGDNRQRLNDFCEKMDKLGVPWCPVLGNHEGDNPMSVLREEMAARFAQSEHCIIEIEPKYTADGKLVDGYGNTAVHIKNEVGEIVTTLICLDTGADLTEEEKIKFGFPVDKSKDGYLRENQIAWYQEEMAKRNSKAPVMVFGHYPLPEFKDGYEFATENDTSYEAGVLKNGSKWLHGYRRERVCSMNVNTGFFDVMRDSGIPHTYICGHDHVNDFRVQYQGVNLYYNAPSGYSSYNVICNRDRITVGKTMKLLQGASLYTIHEDGSMDMDYINYVDRYPEMQEGLMKVIRLNR